MQEILGSLIALAILFGFGYLISLLFKSKIRKAEKWTDLKSWARAQGYELPKKANPLMDVYWSNGTLSLCTSWINRSLFLLEKRSGI